MQEKSRANLCEALICLIPKQYPPETVKHLRPISLCNTVYKIVTKIIVNRLKPFMPNLISQNQNSFTKGRGPDVNLVVASEVLHSMWKKKGKLGWFALKIDLEKAYDRLEWSFVRQCLDFQGVDHPTIDLIMDCISKSSSAIIVNGRKGEAFQHTRGLRQGDPMSPYLFNICLETLSHMINQACADSEWTPFWVGRKKVSVSHLMFADDLLLFGGVEEKTAFAVRDILKGFSDMSGQKVNEDKSRLTFSPNTLEAEGLLMQETLGIAKSDDLGMYLGLPLMHTRPKRREVQFIVEKVRSKLAKWKTSFLSRAGRLCLIRSTLSTIPAYYMQDTFLPLATSRDIDQICINFLWGETIGARKLHLVDRMTTLLPKKEGGLGVRNQQKMNLALMAKLGWKLSNQEDNLASKCIFSKYVHSTHVTSFKYGSPVWKSVGKGWSLLAESSLWVKGDGSSINFWGDNWLAIGPLRSLFHRPLTEREEALPVRDVWVDGSWDLSAISFPLPRCVLYFIHGIVVQPNSVDQVCSTFASPKGFSTALAYKILCPKSTNLESVDWIWKTPTLPKIQFFVWLLWKDRIPHNLLLFQRKIITSPFCPRCGLSLENSQHILRECPGSIQVWDLLPPAISINQSETKSWLKSNLLADADYMGLKWNTLFSWVCYEIWIAHNLFVFEGKQSTPPSILAKAKAQAWSFSKAMQTRHVGPSNLSPKFHPQPCTMIHTDAS